MVVHHVIYVLSYTIMAISAFNIESYKFDDRGSKVCNKMVTDPHFNLEAIIGKPWRVYYAWNYHDNVFYDRCLEVKFKNATPMIVNRIWNDMYEYLNTQPYWSSAVLLMTIPPNREMLLFSDDGIPGKFIGVANLMRSASSLPNSKNSIPLFKINLNILHKGRWLVVADCNIGVTSLSLRLDMEPLCKESDLLEVASSLDIGDGIVVCAMEHMDVNSPNRLALDWQQNKNSEWRC